MDEQLTSDLLILAQEFLDNMRPEKMVILSVSSEVRDVYELYSGDQAPTKIKVGGGTRFHPAFQWVNENEPFCDGLVYLTDGYSNDLRNLQEQPYPVLWVSYGLQSKHYTIGEAIDAPPSNAGIAA
jgi:predicted metal-dependent peptidase